MTVALPGNLARAVAIALLSLLVVYVHPAHAADDRTDGRLGGTYGSFIERFGEPTELRAGLGSIFELDDTRYLAVQFSQIDNDYADDDPALVITVSADRDEFRPADEVDPGDWSWDTAQTIAEELAPADATFAPVDESVPGSRSMVCTSDALLEAFGVVSLGQCRATYLLSSDDTVSFVTLTLTSGADVGLEAATPGQETCTGVVEWANRSAERLAAAQTLLDTLATLDDDPAVAVPALRELAAALNAFADEQRSAEAPAEIATANYYIIGALNDFASAIELAADGLEQADQALVDEAVDDLDAADERAANASAEIEAAVTACDLTTGTPEALTLAQP